MKKSICALIGFLLIGCAATGAKLDSERSPATSDPSSLRSPGASIKDFDPNRVLSAANIRDDLNYLAFAISHAYSGYQFAPERGSQAFLDSLSEWKDQAQTSTKDFYKFLYSKAGLVQDGHFLIELQRPPSGRTGTGVGSNYGKNQNSVWELNWYSPQIPVISIHAFAPPGNDWNGFLDMVQNLMEKSRNIVIDLRDNGGGNDDEGKELVKKLSNAGSYANPYLSSRMLQNPFALQIFLNSIDLFSQMQGFGSDQAGWDTMRRQTEDNLTKALAGTIPAVREDDYSNSNAILGPSAYKGKVFVLVNRHTVSSGETTTDYLRMLPFVSVVGENTEGGIHFITLGIAELPNSKIAIGLATDYKTYRDGSFRELKGIEPSIKVPDGVDALEFLSKSGSMNPPNN
jgi:hypothetical protein